MAINFEDIGKGNINLPDFSAETLASGVGSGISGLIDAYQNYKLKSQGFDTSSLEGSGLSAGDYSELVKARQEGYSPDPDWDDDELSGYSTLLATDKPRGRESMSYNDWIGAADGTIPEMSKMSSLLEGSKSFLGDQADYWLGIWDMYKQSKEGVPDTYSGDPLSPYAEMNPLTGAWESVEPIPNEPLSVFMDRNPGYSAEPLETGVSEGMPDERSRLGGFLDFLRTAP
tara:strand:+ start:3970 stop:4656 length:687 start_codon:yes stop_codon:yes gene_type:complete